MMRPATWEAAAAGIAGLVFGLGLVLSGMSNPAKVLGFLDLAGPWDPSLALVMAGAIAVGLVGFAMARKRAASVLGLPMRIPTTGTVDRRLAVGAIVFGIGWGLVGLCPGPAVVALSSGSLEAILFVAAMLAGMAIYEFK
jgi:uncharacterized membrane protein YedE/YeeE